MKKRCMYVLILHLFPTYALLAQTGTIRGTVSDQTTGIILSDVSISIDQTNNHVHSNGKGNFMLVNLAYGAYELEFEKAGYEKQTQKIIINSTDTLNLPVSLVSKSISLGEIAIAADKPVSAASSSYISQASFSNRPKNSAQDLLRLVPGLFIAQHAGGGKAEQIFIRGFDCDHGTDIATFVDGLPVNMPSHGHGQGYADLHFLIPEVVEGMNVFKGTSSPLYGDFATGAAVNFKTYDSLPNNLIQLEGGSVPQTGSMTSTRGLALLKLPFSPGKVSSYFAADVINNSGYFKINQDFKRVNIFSKTTVALNDYSKIQLTVSGFGSSWNASGQIPERAVASGLISRYGSIDPNEGGTTQRNNYNLVYNTKLGSGEFEAQAYVSTYRFKLFSDFTFFLNDPVNGDMIEQDDNRTVRGLNCKYTSGHTLLGMHNRFTLGATYRSDEIENQLWHAPQRIRLNAEAHALIHQRSSAIYMNEVFRFSSHFRAEVGLRYDYFVFDVEDLIPTDSAHKNYTGFNYQSAFNPKLNLIYTANDRLQFFFNTGSGYHSNDARSVVQDKTQHHLPIAVSTELGTLFHIRKTVISAAVWAMDLSNELVYVGDDGTTENRGASRRYGVDVSLRSQILTWLFADADLNFSQGRLIDTLFGQQRKTNYYIPLAPVLTSTGGLTAKFNNGLEFSLRYRYMKDRPANESNTIVAHGYCVMDFTANYKVKRYKFGLVIENLLNTQWNEAQFDTETRLRNESKPIDELHFTPGTPFYAKLIVGYVF
ncbi:MAG: TonB-dependent receptor [Bacteroidetes bacterium]|nr:TonB-dependent receptor [Bacteroidota bacterium]